MNQVIFLWNLVIFLWYLVIFLFYLKKSMYNVFMKIEKSALYERLMIFFAAVVQLVGFYISITIEDYTHSFLPYCTIVVPAVNISCAAICLVLVFFYKIRFMHSVVLFIQGITMTLNNLMFLGLYLYFFGIALLFCNGYFKTDIRKKVILCLVPLFLSLFVILPVSRLKFFMAVAYSLFLTFAFSHIYNILKDSMFDLFPFLSKKISKIDLLSPKKQLRLSDYGISGRQSKFVEEFLNGETNYKNLAEIFITSESTVKREMAEICRKLGVENAMMLRLLLNQYSEIVY